MLFIFQKKYTENTIYSICYDCIKIDKFPLNSQVLHTKATNIPTKLYDFEIFISSDFERYLPLDTVNISENCQVM